MHDLIKRVETIQEEVKALGDSAAVNLHLSVLAGEKGLIPRETRNQMWESGQPFTDSLRKIDRLLEVLKDDLRDQPDGVQSISLLRKLINILTTPKKRGRRRSK